ncbi:MAG: hypothetical protein WAM60_11045 [Candidatus Promineifilaceae bacterium]
MTNESRETGNEEHKRNERVGRSKRFVPLYRPEDDTYCWLCNGPVEKRHCKIICQVCGFMRDCSDP